MNIERLQQTIREISASGLTPVVLRGAYVLLPYTVQNAQDLHALFERLKKPDEYWIITGCSFEWRPNVALEDSLLPAMARARAVSFDKVVEVGVVGWPRGRDDVERRRPCRVRDLHIRRIERLLAV